MRSSTRWNHSKTLTKIRGKENVTVIGDIISIRVHKAGRNNGRKMNVIGIMFKIHILGSIASIATEFSIIFKNTNTSMKQICTHLLIDMQY